METQSDLHRTGNNLQSAEKGFRWRLSCQLLLAGILTAATSGSVLSATAGLPFTEDFSNDNLLAIDAGSGRWSEQEQAVLQAFRQSRYGGLADSAGLAGTNLGSNTNNTRSIAVGDVDGDGDADILLGNNLSGTTSGQVIEWYANNGTVTPFNGVTPSYFGDAVSYNVLHLADVDLDGDLDLLAGVNSGFSKLYLNSGNATPFSTSQDIGGAATARDLVIADINTDGLPDLVVAYDSAANLVFFNDGDATPFSTAGIAVGSETDSSFGIAVGDVDADGDLDVVSANSNAANKLYLNAGAPGFLQSVSATDITTDADDSRSVKLADLNNDGRLDVLVGNSGAANKLYLNAGATLFAGVSAQAVGGSDDTRKIFATDVNQDGYLDVIAINNGNNRLYLNNASISPFNAVSGLQIGSDASLNHDAVVHDLDGDGDLDLVATRPLASTLQYFNTGTPNPFNTGASTTVSNAAVTAANDLGRGIAVGDMDGDGDLDIVVATLGGSQSNLLFLNDGDTTPFSSAGLSIGSETDFSMDIAVGDVDLDGDLDVVTATVAGTNKLYRNDGDANPFDSLPALDIGSASNLTYAIALADMNGDGLLDVVVANDSNSVGQNNRVILNDGDSDPLNGAGVTLGSELERNQGLAIGDVDGDGDLDVVVANASSSENNRLYRNDGSGQSFTSSVVGTETDPTSAVALADLDGDGDLDLVTANSGAGVANRLYLNDGTATPFSAAADTVIGAETDISLSVKLADINHDGFIDIIIGNDSGGANPNRVYLNRGTATPFDSSSVAYDVGSETDDSYHVAIADIDQDGDVDILSANLNARSRIWLNNGAAGLFGLAATQSIGSESDISRQIAAGDVDGDGDLDVVVGNNGVNRLYLNQGGAAPFVGVTASAIGSETDDTRAVLLSDLDRDGDLDLLTGNNGINRVYLNNGSSDPFGGVSALNIGAESDNSYALAVADINQDGYPDVISANAFANNRLYLNSTTAFPFLGAIPATLSSDSDDSRAIVLADLDGDGDVDAAVANVGASNKLYLNDGDADPFSSAAILIGSADTDNSHDLALGDLDQDGDLDVVVANDTVANKYYLNAGASFAANGVAISSNTEDSRGIALADMNQDGDLDVVIANNGTANRLVYGDGDATPFNSGSPVEIDTRNDASRRVLLADIDRDGRTDALFANSGNDTSPNSGIENTLFSSIRFVDSPRVMVSRTVDTESDNITRARLTPTVSGADHADIQYFLSNDGGVRFHQVRPGEYFTFPTLASDLRWKAEFSSRSPVSSVRLSQVDISINDAPVFDTAPSINELTPVVGDTLTLSYAVSDPNAALGDTVVSPQQFKWYAVGEEGTTLGTEQTYTLQVSDAHKTIRCDVTATDSLGASTTESTTGIVVVNTSPVAVDDTLATNEDSAVDFDALVDLVSDDSDADNDSLSLGSIDTASTAGGAITDLGGGSYRYTPASNFNGSDTFTYTVSDGNGGSDSGTVTVNVSPQNDPPTISGSPATSVIPGNSYSFTPISGDIDGDTLVFAITNKPVWADFDPAIGALTSSGPVSDGDYGSTTGIVISVTDNIIPAPVELAAFNIDVLDVVAPVPAASRASGDYNQSPLDVSLSCSDSGSGGTLIYFTLDGSNPTTSSPLYTSTLNFSGDAQLKFICRDAAGNQSSVQTRDYNIDLVDPIPAVDVPGGAYQLTQNVTLSCSDDDSGAGDIYFTINGADPVVGTPGQLYGGGPIPISEDSTVKLVCADLAGNVAAILSVDYIIDAIAPTVQSSISGGAYNAVQSVELMCIDSGSGADTIFFTDDGSDPLVSGSVQTYASAIAVNSNTRLRFYCNDAAGNQSSLGDENFIIDLVKPVNGATPAAGSFGSAQQVTLSCNDEVNGSGPGAIFYTLDGSVPTTSSSQFSAPIAVVSTTTIRHFCQDLAGNSSDIDDRVYTIDAGAPSVSIATPQDQDNFLSVASISGTASDNNAVASVEVEISGASGSGVIDIGSGLVLASGSAAQRLPAIFNSGSWSLDTSAVGWTLDVYTLTAYVTDNAGNTSFDSRTFSINRVPTISGAPSVTTLTPGNSFSFTPTSGDEDLSFGDVLSFSIQNQPVWATQFDTATGQLSGTPVIDDFGEYPDIIITVTDEFGSTASLGSFTLNVTDNTAPVPAVDDAPGSYNSDPGIELSCSDSGSQNTTIFYTTDGSVPTTSSSQYSAPIALTGDLVIQYFCQDAAGNQSSVVTLDYVFDTEPPLLSISNPTEGDFINALTSVDAIASDNDVLDSVEFEINGSNHAVILSGGSPVLAPGATPDRIPASLINGVWRLLMPFSWLADSYTITAYATDAAGNQTIVQRSFNLFVGDQAFTTLSIETSAPSILNGETIDISGKLTRLPDDDAIDLSDLPIVLTVTDPDGVGTTFETVTSSRFGHFQFLAANGNAIDGFNKKGNYLLSAHFAGNAALSDQTSEPVSVLVGTSAGYALIVQGKLDDSASPEGLESHNKTTNRIYNTLINRGFDPQNILYYNYDDTQDGVDGVPSKAATQDALENLLPSMSAGVAAPLYIYMVDHGSPDLFHIGAETISPTELDQWMTTMENNLSSAMQDEIRYLVYGACYSGSFIPTLSSPGRIIVASAAADEESYKGPLEDDGVRVGEFFIEEFLKQLERGYSFKDAFNTATELTETFTRVSDSQTDANQYFDTAAQHPLLDDNGDGVGSNLLDDSSLDGLLSNDVYLGVGVSITNSALIPAEFLQVTETSFVTAGSNSLTLYGIANNDGDVASAWIEVRRPNKVLVGQGGSIQLEVDLDKSLMSFNSAENRWEASYNQFTDEGLYEVFYYVKDAKTDGISPAIRSVVYKQKSVNQPPTTVELLSPVEAEEIKTVSVFDWSDATDPDVDSVSYTLEIATDIAFTNDTIVLRQDGLVASVAMVDDSTPIPDSATLYWRVIAIDQFGETSVSAVNSLTTNNTNGVPGIIQGLVYANENFARLLGANVATTLQGSPSIAVTEYNGQYILLSDAGNSVSITISSDAGEFDDQVISGVSVTAGKTTEVNIGIDVAGTGGGSNSSPVNSVLPAISGNATVGSTLTASEGSWIDADNDILSFSYQWMANGTAINGATNSSYDLVDDDAGKSIAVQVTANDGNGGVLSVTSNSVTISANSGGSSGGGSSSGGGGGSLDFPLLLLLISLALSARKRKRP